MHVPVAAVLAAGLFKGLLITLAVLLVLGIIAFLLLRRFVRRHARALAIGAGAVLSLCIGGVCALEGGVWRGIGFVLLIVGGFFLWALWSRRGDPKTAGPRPPGA
jgi:hypothetical protein